MLGASFHSLALGLLKLGDEFDMLHLLFYQKDFLFVNLLSQSRNRRFIGVKFRGIVFLHLHFLLSLLFETIIHENESFENLGKVTVLGSEGTTVTLKLIEGHFELLTDFTAVKELLSLTVHAHWRF